MVGPLEGLWPSPDPDAFVGQVGLLGLDEGRSLPILHMGSDDAEGPTPARLHREVMPERGPTWNGRHHEIHLGDPRRSAPERLRTALRQPVRPVRRPLSRSGPGCAPPRGAPPAPR